jgi:peroxiredoxin (alkyl hydroperoxide reductase subunit C)
MSDSHAAPATTLVQRPAPEFTTQALVGGEFKQISLASYRGKWVVLFFYPLDFTFVCPTEITSFSDRIGEFEAFDAVVLGCSVDSHFSHLAWSKQPRDQGGIGQVAYPLLSDLGGRIAGEYGVLGAAGNLALRGLFLINPQGTVQYQVVHDLGVGRNVDEVLRVLAALQQITEHGEVCPAGWTPGAQTMKPDPEGSKEYFRSS